MDALKKAILSMVKMNLAVQDIDLHKEFAMGENMEEITNIKAAAILLAEDGKCLMQNDSTGGYILTVRNIDYH